MGSRSIQASGRRAIIHAKGPCLDEGKEGARVHRTAVRSSAPWHFPISQGCLRYLCSVSNEVIQDGEALLSQRAGRPARPGKQGLREVGAVGQRERQAHPALPLLWLLLKEGNAGPMVAQNGAYLLAPLPFLGCSLG